MKITMLVSVSTAGDAGVSAKIGQTLDVDADFAQEFIANGWAKTALQIQSVADSADGDGSDAVPTERVKPRKPIERDWLNDVPAERVKPRKPIERDWLHDAPTARAQPDAGTGEE